MAAKHPEYNNFEQLQFHSTFVGQSADWPCLGKVPTPEQLTTNLFFESFAMMRSKSRVSS